MGQVIPRSAAPHRIVDHVKKTLSNARSRGGAIQNPAESRLGALEGPISDNTAVLSTAEKTAQKTSSALDAADHESDGVVGAVIDEIWNKLGRPARSVDYTVIVGSGKAQWTDGDPTEQHLLMGALAANITNTKLEMLQDGKAAWAERITVKANAQEAAAAASKVADAAVFTLVSQQRSLAKLAQVALTRLKRDYLNQGLTETQIHEVIPDYVPKPRPKPAMPAEPPVTPGAPTPVTP